MREHFHNQDSYIKRDLCPICRIQNGFMRVGNKWQSLCCKFEQIIPPQFVEVERKTQIEIPYVGDGRICIIIGG